MALSNPSIDLVNINVFTKFGKILSIFILKILSLNQILISIKGSNSVANFQKNALYNPKIDHVNNNVCTKFCLILSISSQDIE